jgi:hypothetical protein
MYDVSFSICIQLFVLANPTPFSSHMCRHGLACNHKCLANAFKNADLTKVLGFTPGSDFVLCGLSECRPSQGFGVRFGIDFEDADLTKALGFSLGNDFVLCGMSNHLHKVSRLGLGLVMAITLCKTSLKEG